MHVGTGRSFVEGHGPEREPAVRLVTRSNRNGSLTVPAGSRIDPLRARLDLLEPSQQVRLIQNRTAGEEAVGGGFREPQVAVGFGHEDRLGQDVDHRSNSTEISRARRRSARSSRARRLRLRPAAHEGRAGGRVGRRRVPALIGIVSIEHQASIVTGLD